MERRQFIGLILLGLIFAAYMAYMSMSTRSTDTTKPAAEISNDSLRPVTTQETPKQETIQPATTIDSARQGNFRYGALFAPFMTGNQTTLTVETPTMRVQLSSVGAVVQRWRLKQFKSWFGEEVQLVPLADPRGELGISFTTHEGKEVDTRDLYFTLTTSRPQSGNSISLQSDDSLVVTATLALNATSSIQKTLTFYGNRYEVGVSVALPGMDHIIANHRYEFSWKSGLQYQELYSDKESDASKALIVQNKNIEELDATDVAAPVQTSGSGTIDYAAIKSKYFVAAIIPRVVNGDAAVYLDGKRHVAERGGFIEQYDMALRLPTTTSGKTDRFTVYVGPLDYDVVKQYGLESTVEFGARWIIRPIGEFFMLPFFQAIYRVIPNYGIAIIVFSLLLRILMQPLMASQMRSSQKMQVLAPEMEKLKQKYKDDPTTQQQETMKLYSEYGINPAGGCLPLILQIPIMIALYNLLDSAISLRQTPFFGWITDLSIPDVVFRLPFKIPVIGVDNIVGLAILMGITMIFQQKLTTPIAAPGNQQMMMYLFPIVLTFSFSNLPSGLSLYYFIQNFIGIVYQVYMNKFSKNKLTLEDLKKMPKKEGWLQRKMKEAQSIAAAQGKTLPGQSVSNGSAAKQKNQKKR